jgi:hypothetical protein
MTSDGSSVTTVITGEAMDSGDKATNKAMSVALKYALLQMFLIPTDDMRDPDATTHPEVKPAATSKSAPPSKHALPTRGTDTYKRLVDKLVKDSRLIAELDKFYTLSTEQRQQLIADVDQAIKNQ